MSPGTESSPPLIMDSKYRSKETGSLNNGGAEGPKSSEIMKGAKARKPPRHLSIIRHSVSSARLVCDCRAVLGKRGRAIELSNDHKPNCNTERCRIERLGGSVYDGYLNGQLSVARALGDWHMKGSKGSACPLSAEPELQETILTEEDEFLIMGCDGIWDVMSSQCAVTMTRKELMLHNDPEKCSRVLVREALKRNTCDNLTVVVICFSPDPPPRIEIPRTRVRRSISLEGLHVLRGALDNTI
ncbi:hypothetical protein BHE74_00035200 [Ensete ventricosum]|nr:hypothetical protein GW17_00050115 [Ensete ventricosum]RWW57980.1 hypothetical protein BHE74_00035200 [Ensete ventricosum]RZR95220.1 hypothetical protein BHM03_00024041 [Ensete ventricosum]